MFLYLDTTEDNCEIKLFDANGKFTDAINFNGVGILSEELLNQIELLFRKNKINKKNINAVLINPGPGSYTGLRIGVTVANLLAYSNNIPVLKQSFPLSKAKLKNNCFISPVLPIYLNPPHITSKKPGR